MDNKPSITVIKRDGKVVEFDRSKIVNAIQSANREVSDKAKVCDATIDLIATSIEVTEVDFLTVEQIQDMVEKMLMFAGCHEVAKAYIIYRNDRTRERLGRSGLIGAVRDKISAKNTENSNANVDESSFSGMEKEASGVVQKAIAFDFGGMSDDASRAHKEMLIYQHDADKAILGEHNCLFIDFDRVFNNGFGTRNGDVRPPKSVSTACQQVAVLFQCQSQVCECLTAW